MIARRTPAEIERIRASCRIVSLVQQILEKLITPGISTLELNDVAEQTIHACGARPAFKGYRGFPASICTSINAEAVHGFPRREALREGDILSVDVGVCLDGYYGDGAFSVGVGRIAPALQHLLDTARAALAAGIARARAGGRLSNISHAIQTCVERENLSLVREFGGHGIGRALHEDPHVSNCGAPGKGPRLRSGFVLALEPIVSMGRPQVVTADDGWTTLAQDGSPVAHFEHTVAITGAGPKILTLPGAAARAGTSRLQIQHS